MEFKADLTEVALKICGQRKAELLRELGRGAFKQTFLISEGNELFALKVAPTTPALIPRFEREAFAMQGCAHPAIARLYASEATAIEGKPHWVSVEEYLAGGTLGAKVADGPLSPDRVRQIAKQMISAVAHLCDRRLVHRDIKPENILFRGSGEAVLTDFGIVRMLDAPTLTKAFMPAGPGTPLYAAPEQLRNEIPQIDWRADQFGLAVVLAECLLGHHPFSPEGDQFLAITRIAQRYKLPESTIERLGDQGFACLIKAMSPWPAQRFRKATDFLEAT